MWQQATGACGVVATDEQYVVAAPRSVKASNAPAMTHHAPGTGTVRAAVVTMMQDANSGRTVPAQWRELTGFPQQKALAM